MSDRVLFIIACCISIRGPRCNSAMGLVDLRSSSFSSNVLLVRKHLHFGQRQNLIGTGQLNTNVLTCNTCFFLGDQLRTNIGQNKVSISNGGTTARKRLIGNGSNRQPAPFLKKLHIGHWPFNRIDIFIRIVLHSDLARIIDSNRRVGLCSDFGWKDFCPFHWSGQFFLPSDLLCLHRLVSHL